MSFIEPICPPLSQNEGRCGSSWGGRCNNNLVDYAVYCNEDNGWCGTTSEHKHAQSSDIYDWASNCKPDVHFLLNIGSEIISVALNCNKRTTVTSSSYLILINLFSFRKMLKLCRRKWNV